MIGAEVPRCGCGKPTRIDGMCWRCYERSAPYGYIVCAACGYEKAVGLPCGEPCV